jgi:predicted RNA-binding Zn-ribbon protein involved in translation (DUF1610 family)
MSGRYLLSSALLLIAWVGVLAAGSAAQEALTEISLIQNGGFESGLAGWQKIDSGIGQSSVSHFVAHSGSSSLLTDLRPTSAVSATEVQGVFQKVSVRNLRDLTVTVYLLTAPCPLSAGTLARLIIQVGQLAVHYDAQGVCGNWQRLNPPLKTDFQSAFGSEGMQLFQLDNEVQIVITLELLRFGANYMALAEYVSANWDDVEVLASIPTETATIATAVANTSITVNNSTSTVGATTSATPRPTTLTQVSIETRYLLGSPEQFYTILALVFATAFGFSIALLLTRNVRNRRASAKILCRKCGAGIPEDPEAKFCPECGSELALPHSVKRAS